MNHIHICLVSDQTIPNILSIHHFKPDEILFVSSRKMEEKKKSQHILSTLQGMGLDYKTPLSSIIEVLEDSIPNCHDKLNEWIKGREDSKFTVNITGGTKIMSLAVYEYFKDYGSQIIYIPLPKNEFTTPFPKRIPKVEPLTLRLKVVDYLSSYGLTVKNIAEFTANAHDAAKRKDHTYWLIDNYVKVKNLLVVLGGCLRDYRDDRDYQMEASFSISTNEESEFLKNFGFTCDGKKITKHLLKSEIQFLTGGWLEEFCFNEVFQFIGKGIDDVVMGIKIKNDKGTDNEFDVMFTRDNALYTVECKSLDQNEDKKADALYKIGALNKEFGLRIASFFVSTSPHIMAKNGRLEDSVQARADQFNTTVVTPDQVKKFGLRLSEKLKITNQTGKANV